MYNLDLVKVNHALVKSIRMLGAVRRMIGKKGEGYSEIQDIEREVRDGAVECERVLKLAEGSGKGPLILG